MKKFGIAIFAATLIIGLVVAKMFSFGQSSERFINLSVGFKSVKGSGTLVTDPRSVSGFSSVEVGSVFLVEITAQKAFGVEIDADENLLPYIQTEVRRGVLHIETDRKISPSSPIRIRVTAPEIDSVDVSGVANVTVNDIQNADFRIDSSGASTVTASGETAEFMADVSGSTKINAENLKATGATIDASGASTVTVSVSGDLRAEASGASKVFYAGTPTNIDKSTSGSGRVSPR